MRRLLLHHLLAGRTLQLPRCLPRLHDPGEKKTPFGTFEKNFMPTQVKRAASVLARLHECKYLLLSLVVITVLPAIPELFIRSKSLSLFISNLPPGPLWSPLVRASAFSPRGLIVERKKKDFRLQNIFPRDAMYALYILFKLLLRHLLPVVLVLLCLFRPRLPSSPK